MTITERKRKNSPHQPVGCWIRKETRLAIYLRDQFRCLGCGANLHGADPFSVTLDHIKPVSRGGSNKSTNLYTCCRSCNSARADKTLNQFYTEEASSRIRRFARRSLRKYRILAKDIITGENADA